MREHWVMPLGQMFNPSSAPAPAANGGGAPAAAPVAGGGAAAPATPVAGGDAAATTGASGAAATGAATQPAQQPPGLSGMILPIILMFGLLYLFLFRGQRKDEKKRKAMLSEMKKGDTVMTIGGLVARVVSVDGDDVVLKIDESANVKATYKKSAIQQVLGGEEKK